MGGQGARRKKQQENRGLGSQGSGATVPAAQQERNYDNVFREALNAHEKGEKPRRDAVACLRQALALYEEAETLFPPGQNSSELHFNIGCVYTALAAKLKDQEKDVDAEAALLSACEQYGIVCHWGPHAEALNNWAAALTSFASSQNREEAKRLVTLACEKNEECCRLSPSDFEAHSNWADCLFELASLTDDLAEAKALVERACALDESAIGLAEYDYDRCDILCNMGEALSALATRLGDAGAIDQAHPLFGLAIDKLRWVAERQRGDADAHAHLGQVLHSSARFLADPADGYRSAAEAFGAALHLDRRHDDAAVGLGEVFLDWGRLTRERDHLQRALQSFQSSLANQEDATVHYNAACAAALLGDMTTCSTHSTRCVQLGGGEMARDMAADADLQICLTEPWFGALMSTSAHPEGS
mmetsp:Transcript_25292/g.54842  ORF Transcript_25292/g.54842 Transcript_25292/m.54842 type:complete len:417 (-) Transcript_25292:75-1325(-)